MPEMSNTNNPRGHAAGKVPSAEQVARKAAAGAGLQFGQLLAWKVYPGRVVLIGRDGKKHIVARAGANPPAEEVE